MTVGILAIAAVLWTVSEAADQYHRKRFDEYQTAIVVDAGRRSTPEARRKIEQFRDDTLVDTAINVEFFAWFISLTLAAFAMLQAFG